ncbi:MAG: hypothetical protein J0H57_04555, partial [Rhodospirillales bacterium]|nr:hypothetical protein [Rhodospirillales bacterium]
MDGGAALPLSSGSRTPVDLSSLFVMPDLGASGVVGSRRVGALPSAETRVTGSHAECGSEPPPPPPRARDRAARILTRHNEGGVDVGIRHRGRDVGRRMGGRNGRYRQVRGRRRGHR